jgi:hypothetical protein
MRWRNRAAADRGRTALPPGTHTRNIRNFSIALVLFCSAPAALSAPFSYQGRLTTGGEPAHGVYSIRFRLMDAATGGAQIGPTLTAPSVEVEDGLFTVDLNFGDAAFTSAGDRWMEISVAGAGSANFQPLSPRQRVSAAPRAMGLVWPTSGTAASAQPMLNLANTSSGTTIHAGNGGTGVAVRAEVTSPQSSANALVATNVGAGAALLAQTTGSGKAAVIRNTNSTNTEPALSVTTNSNATAAEFRATSATGTKPAVIAKNDGDGVGLYCEAADPEAAALKIKGALSFVGNGALFRVYGYAPNTYVWLDHPLLNGKPDAVFFVQERPGSLGAGPLMYPDYNYIEQRWMLRQRYQPQPLAGNAWDILVVKREGQ